MNQSHLDRAVARATGESVNLIRRRGFGLLLAGSSTAGNPSGNMPAGPHRRPRPRPLTPPVARGRTDRPAG